MGGLDVLHATTDVPPVLGKSRRDYVATLIAALGDGATVSVLCASRTWNGPEDIRVDELAGGGVWVTIPLERSIDRYSAETSRAFAAATSEAVERLGLKADAVHAHDALAWEAAGAVASQTSAERRVITFHDAAFIAAGGGAPASPAQLDVEREAARDASAVIVASEHAGALAAGQLGDLPEPPRPLPCPASFERLAAPDPELRGRFARDDETLVMLVGQPSPVSGVRELAHAIGCDAARERRIRGLVIGGVESMTNLYGWPAPEDIANVTLLPWLEGDELRRFYAIADVGVVSSLWAPNAEIAADMLAAGLPLAFSDTGAHRELLSPLSSPAVIGLSVSERGLHPLELRQAVFALAESTAPSDRGERAETAAAYLAGAASREAFARGHLEAYGAVS